jgi:hypothetical protein
MALQGAFARLQSDTNAVSEKCPQWSVVPATQSAPIAPRGPVQNVRAAEQSYLSQGNAAVESDWTEF